MEKRKFGRQLVVASFLLSASGLAHDVAAQDTPTADTDSPGGDGPDSLAAQRANVSETPNGETHEYPPCLTEPDDAATAAAKGAFQAGNAAFQESDYNRAILYWEDAFRRACTADAMLKNLARAYELNNQPEQALIALKTYVKRAPGKDDLPAVERRIDTLEAKLAPPAPEPSSGSDPDLDPVTLPTEASSLGPPEETDAGVGERSITPLIVGGVGLAALGVGLGFWLDATSRRDDAVRECGVERSEDCQIPEFQTAGNRAVEDQQMWTFINIGTGALAVAGVIWYFAQDDGSEQETVLAPAIAPGYAGVQLSGSF